MRLSELQRNSGSPKRQQAVKTYHWSDWRPMAKPPRSEAPAVYEFRLAEQGRPRPINRFLAIDADGILVIGSTGNMSRRIVQSRFAVRRAKGSSTLSWI